VAKSKLGRTRRILLALKVDPTQSDGRKKAEP
jgi:hypothetical protein